MEKVTDNANCIESLAIYMCLEELGLTIHKDRRMSLEMSLKVVFLQLKNRRRG